MRRSSARRLRTPTGIIVLALSVLLAWRCITLGMADLLAGYDPAAATWWRPGHALAQYEVAQADFLMHRDADAIVHARMAISSNPLDGRGYRILAAVAERAGDRVRAEHLFAMAERRAPRDLATRIKMAAFALKAGDLERAVHEVDMLLRMQPELDPDVLPRLVRLSGDAAAIDPIVHALSHRPAWSNAFLSLLAASAPDTATAGRLFSRVARLHGLSPAETESQRVLQKRINDRASDVGPALRTDAATAPAATDWYALMGWKSIDDKAYAMFEDAYDSIGTP